MSDLPEVKCTIKYVFIGANALTLAMLSARGECPETTKIMRRNSRPLSITRAFGIPGRGISVLHELGGSVGVNSMKCEPDQSAQISVVGGDRVCQFMTTTSIMRRRRVIMATRHSSVAKARGAARPPTRRRMADEIWRCAMWRSRRQ